MLKSDKPNINTKKHMEEAYHGGGWKVGYGSAEDRFKLEVSKLEHFTNILDVGCADGGFLKEYAKHYATDAYGCDISEEVIKQAKLNFPQGHFIQADIYDLPYDIKFKAVVCSEVLEHLDRPWDALRQIHKVLEPEGILIITTPNEDVAEYEEHLWRWNLEGINDLLRGSFEIEEEYKRFFNNSILYIRAKRI